MKKSSLGSAAAVLRDLADWLSRRGSGDYDATKVPYVVSACGYRFEPAQDEDNAIDTRPFAVPRDRWAPGPSLDNFS